MADTPFLDTPAALVTNTGTPTLSDGKNSEGVTQFIVGGNSAMKSGDNLYCVIADELGGLQVYKSNLTGANWATFGPATTQTEHGGAMCAVLFGTTIHVGYCGPAQTPNLYYRSFDIGSQTWSVERMVVVSVANPDAHDWEGPYMIWVRPDNTVVFMGNETAGTANNIIAVWDGATFAVYVPAFAVNNQYASSIMDNDGTIHIFSDAYDLSFSIPQHQVFNLDNSSTALMPMTGFAQLLDWNGNGLENGFYNAQVSSFFFAAGIKTADYPTIWGRPCILYGNDSGWILTAELDTTLDPDFSMYDAALFETGDYYTYLCRLIDSAGNNYILRFGYALAANFADPAAWTWTTAYDMRTPDPAVPGEEGPGAYVPLVFKGPNSGLIIGDDNVARYMTTLTHSQFVAFLLSVSASSPAPSTPTYFPYIDLSGVPTIPINFHVAAPTSVLTRYFCKPKKG